MGCSPPIECILELQAITYLKLPCLLEGRSLIMISSVKQNTSCVLEFEPKLSSANKPLCTLSKCPLSRIKFVRFKSFSCVVRIILSNFTINLWRSMYTWTLFPLNPDPLQYLNPHNAFQSSYILSSVNMHACRYHMNQAYCMTTFDIASCRPLEFLSRPKLAMKDFYW